MTNRLFLILSGLCFFSSVFVACQKSETAPIPILNGTAATVESLGKLLFYDPILSGNKDVACATCHHPSLGYTDNRDLSVGVNAVGLGINRHFLLPNSFSPAKRKSMTILNTAFNGMDDKGNYDPANAPMFWDSRSRSLEQQVLGPITSDVEMRAKAYPEAVAIDSVVARLRNIPEYQALFTSAFGGSQAVTSINMARAIAAFERTLTAINSPFDKYKRGEVTAMTPQQIQGMNDFQTAGCAGCHSGTMFSDYKLHVLSAPDNIKSTTSDSGNGTFAFRTVSLRNTKLTAPYMHSGVFQTLNDVVSFYTRIAGGNSQNPRVNSRQIDPIVRNINVRPNQIAALVAFINALTDENFDKTVPVSVPSKLNVGGNIK